MAYISDSVTNIDRSAVKLNEQKVAVLVVDVQMAVFSSKQFGEEFHDRVESCITKMNTIIDKVRRNNGEIIFCVMESLTADGRDRSLDYKLSGIHIPKNSPLAAVCSTVHRADDDIVLSKTSSSPFNGATNIEYLLRNLGVTAVIVTGFLTSQCISATIRDAANHYYVVCAEDCVTDKSSEAHETAIDHFKGYCKVSKAVDIIEALHQTENR